MAPAMVCTSQPSAARAAGQVLEMGGSAVDAALCASLVLGVTEPFSTSLGGDVMALVWDGSSVVGLNGQGRTGTGLDPEPMLGSGPMPERGPASITVPGHVRGLWDLHRRFGALPWEDLFRDAIRLAREGFLIQPRTAATWKRTLPILLEAQDTPAAAGTAVFLVGREAPAPGARLRNPDLADAMEAIAAGGPEVFYTGDLADRIMVAIGTGGLFGAEDLASHASSWEEPIALDWVGHRINHLPPPDQGIAVLEALSILRDDDLVALGPGERTHLLIEATKVALGDLDGHLADPEVSKVSLAGWLSAGYHLERRKAIDRDRVGPMAPGDPSRYSGDTVAVCVADDRGQRISLLSSTYMGWGSGVFCSGFALNDRGALFSTEPGHPNALAPGKRPFHTVIPSIVTHEGRPRYTLGLVGGPMQAQGHIQLLEALVLHGADPQGALDTPRWRVERPDGQVRIEAGFPPTVHMDLLKRGHSVTPGPSHIFGGGQVIEDLGGGGLRGGSDTRKDGMAVWLD